MNTSPVICFGQQPSGIFPKRFLYSKILSARKLQKEIGGSIVFFYHDSDADYHETITILTDRITKEEVRLNFMQPNKIQKKYSPLYCKEYTDVSRIELRKQLPRFVDDQLISFFDSISTNNVADFCLEIAEKMGLLEGITVLRSSDPTFREQAMELTNDFYVDMPYENETVRARMKDGKFLLHQGGENYIELPPADYKKSQVSPARDLRFNWMQSAINATHYIMGEGEAEYFKTLTLPASGPQLILRDKIDRAEYAWIGEEK